MMTAAVVASDTSQDNEPSFSATQESMDNSTPSEVESDVFYPNNGLTSSSDSEQEASNTQLNAGSSISAKNLNAMFLALTTTCHPKQWIMCSDL